MLIVKTLPSGAPILLISDIVMTRKSRLGRLFRAVDSYGPDLPLKKTVFGRISYQNLRKYSNPH